MTKLGLQLAPCKAVVPASVQGLVQVGGMGEATSMHWGWWRQGGFRKGAA